MMIGERSGGERGRISLRLAGRGAWIVLALAGASCAGIPHREYRPDRPLPQGDAAAYWADREHEDSLRKAIRLYEEQCSRKPTVELCNRLSWAYMLLAEMFLPEDSAERSRAHVRGMSVAMTGLRLNRHFREAVDRGTPVRQAIRLLGKEHVGPLFWRTAHLGAWLRLQGLLTQWRHHDLVVALMRRIQELDDTYGAGGVYRMWGAYWARLGRVDRAMACFRRALEIAPYLPVTHRLCATECALRTGNKKLFVEELARALRMREADCPPEFRPEFRLEQRRVRDLLRRADTLFPK